MFRGGNVSSVDVMRVKMDGNGQLGWECWDGAKGWTFNIPRLSGCCSDLLVVKWLVRDSYISQQGYIWTNQHNKMGWVFVRARLLFLVSQICYVPSPSGRIWVQHVLPLNSPHLPLASAVWFRYWLWSSGTLLKTSPASSESLQNHFLVVSQMFALEPQGCSNPV